MPGFLQKSVLRSEYDYRLPRRTLEMKGIALFICHDFLRLESVGGKKAGQNVMAAGRVASGRKQTC